MWPFTARKSETLTARVEEFQYKREDVTLNLSPERVRTLKKILYHHAPENVTTRDFDIYSVSWDVQNLPEPPDGISPLLPPENWGEPDMICIALQRCTVTAAPLWSVVVAHSVHRYSSQFRPLAPEAPFDETSGSLLLLFVRHELHSAVQEYSAAVVGNLPLAAVRFRFHQSSIAIVCGKLESDNEELLWQSLEESSPAYTSAARSFTCADPQVSADSDAEELCPEELEVIHTAMAWEALTRQKFATMLSQLRLDVNGREVHITEHPFIIWVGMKDYAEKGRREERLWETIFLSDRKQQIVSSCLNPFSALEHNKLDVRYTSKILLGDYNSHQFGTPACLMTKESHGRLDILKAGVMRLVLEMADAQGNNRPSEASPELMLLRAAVPVVDSAKLQELYHRAWHVLKEADDNEFPKIKLQPSLIKLEEPVRPWEPCKVSFKVMNTSAKGLPAPFTIYCVSDSGQYVVPLGRHSFLHHSKSKVTVPKTPEITRPSDKYVQTSGMPTDRRTNNNGKSSNWLMKSSRTHRDTAARSASFNSTKKKPTFFGNFLGASKSKKSSTADSPPIASENLADDNDSPRPDLPPTPATINSSSPPMNTLPDFSLTKWMLVEPLEGVVLAGQDVTVTVSIMVYEGFTQPLCNLDPITLVVRVDDCKRDFFLSIDPGRIDPSLDGVSPKSLVNLRDQPILDDDKNLTEAPATGVPSGRSTLMSPSRLVGKTPLPLPKEIWNMLTFIRFKILMYLKPDHPTLPPSWLDAGSSLASDEWFDVPLFLQRAARSWSTTHPRTRADIAFATRCILAHKQIPPSVSIGAVLRILEKWALAMAVPLVPREYITEMGAELDCGRTVHFVCRAMLLSLPTMARNVFLSVCAAIRDLLLFYELSLGSMLPILVESLINDGGSQLPSLKAHTTAAQRDEWYKQMELHWKGDCLPDEDENIPRLFLRDALAYWLARFLTRDTPITLSLPFIRHFLQ